MKTRLNYRAESKNLLRNYYIPFERQDGLRIKCQKNRRYRRRAPIYNKDVSLLVFLRIYSTPPFIRKYTWSVSVKKKKTLGICLLKCRVQENRHFTVGIFFFSSVCCRPRTMWNKNIIKIHLVKTFFDIKSITVEVNIFICERNINDWKEI